jgi:hypothetical protein
MAHLRERKGGIQYILYGMYVIYIQYIGLVAKLTCHLQSSTPYGKSFSHRTYRSSPTKDVT